MATHRVCYEEENGDLNHYSGRLFIAYRGLDGYIRVSYFDGSEWRSPHRLSIRSSQAPALAPIRDSLFIAYKGWSDNNIRITNHGHFRWVRSGSSWSEQTPSWATETQISGCQTDVSPALIAFCGKLYLVYKQAGASTIWWKKATWDDRNLSWEPAERLPGRTTDSPALAAFGDQLFIIYKGSRDHDIYFNIYDQRVGWLGEYDTTCSRYN